MIKKTLDRIKNIIFPSESNGFKSKFLQNKILYFIVVLLLALKLSTIFISINFPQNIFFADITKNALENFVNQTRESVGLEALSENEKLNQAAQLKAENMVQNQYFSHTSPSGVSPWFWFLKVGYNYKYAGENLAIGFFESKEVYNAWLNSPSHKANILNPNYTEIGTAVVNDIGQNNTIIVVQEFASQKPITNVKTTKAKQIEPNTPAEIPAGEKVLSQTTKSEPADFDPLNYFSYDFDTVLQNITYGVLLVVASILLLIIFYNFNNIFNKDFVFRAIIIIGLLLTTMAINKELIITLIPHQMII